MSDEQLLDIHLDFDTLHLALEVDATRAVYEASQKAADDEAARRGGRLRHPDPRETNIQHGKDPLTGRDVLLVSTRWLVDLG